MLPKSLARKYSQRNGSKRNNSHSTIRAQFKFRRRILVRVSYLKTWISFILSSLKFIRRVGKTPNLCRSVLSQTSTSVPKNGSCRLFSFNTTIIMLLMSASARRALIYTSPTRVYLFTRLTIRKWHPRPLGRDVKESIDEWRLIRVVDRLTRALPICAEKEKPVLGIAHLRRMLTFLSILVIIRFSRHK